MRRIYFIGIGGTAMGSVAVELKKQGMYVFGSDEKLYEPMKSVLVSSGIECHEGYSARHLDEHFDQIVIGNAISRGNPEVEEVLRRKLTFCSLPELIGEHLIGQKKSFVITGTHGKSTTTSLLSWIFYDASLEPGYMIGGVPNELPQNCSVGKSDIFVIEGDEYDSAFFDKRSKFLHYSPHCLILNNLEYDHVDIFSSIEDIIKTFQHLISIVPSDGVIIANEDNDILSDILAEHQVTKEGIVPVITYSSTEASDFSIVDLTQSIDGMTFNFNSNKHGFLKVSSKMHGTCQAYNIAASIIAALHYGVEIDKILSAVKKFTGLKRRMEVIYDKNGTVIIDDFAHHPTAIKESLMAVKYRYPNKKIIAVLEPRSNTMRRKIFSDRITESLSVADGAYIAPVFQPEKIPADELLDTDTIVHSLKKQAKVTYACSKIDNLIRHIVDNLTGNEVIVGMSNGGFSDFYNKMKNACEINTIA